MLKQIPVSELSPGMMITKIIEQSGPVKIRKVGFIRSPDMIRGLQEMGVTLVEVDFDQSLTVEADSDEIDAETENSEVVTPKETVNTTTATQRLVISNKNMSDVDRQLSQQFYRSSFMPAVDQMPSKWSIYGKPYAILLAYVVLGVLVGGVSSYTILTMSNNSNLSLTSLISTSVDNTPISATSSTDSPLGSSDAGGSEMLEGTALTSQSAGQTQTADNSNDQQLGEIAKNEKLIDESTAVNQVNDVKSSVTLKEETPPVQRTLVNGVLLEAGQQVFGYQGPADDTEKDLTSKSRDDASNKRVKNTGGNSTNSNDEPINSDLFRRIQRVAKDVDEQPAEPSENLFKVTDLNDLPRIDQLSPALLTRMPEMSFSAHMYASNPQDRWVRVNSRRLGEGDIIGNDVVLKRIESEKVVLEYKGTEFTMNALSDW